MVPENVDISLLCGDSDGGGVFDGRGDDDDDEFEHVLSTIST